LRQSGRPTTRFSFPGNEALPTIAALIRGGSDGVPPKWPGHVYDLIWVLDLQASGDWSFTQIPELVMPGDSEKPIGPGE
jgi:hypothetical protein